VVEIMHDPSRVGVSGPLLPDVDGFAAWLDAQGYASGTVVFHLRVMAHLSRWMQAEGLAVAALGSAAVDGFLAGRPAVSYLARLRRGSFQPLLGYLRAVGVAPAAEAEAPYPSTAAVVEVVLARYGDYLAVERGLAAGTITRNVELVRPFLAGLHRDGRLELQRLRAGEVSAFVLALSREQAGSVARAVTALRSLLRFLHADGLTRAGLAEAVPTVARRKLAGLPKALTSDQVAALLASCDRDTALGRRDLAILTVLWRLGLRAGEVAGLRLDDIDWRRGEITVAGKGRRCERLPLPADVGQAVVSYLAGRRPGTAVREVFACARAPHRAMSRGAVTNVVARAARRAGLGTVHAHRLRHTAATAMLGAGASLTEIGQVLRHRHALTTTIYAKVDTEALRALARVWPGSEATA
jgi:integrase/recombinase XerD